MTFGQVTSGGAGGPAVQCDEATSHAILDA
jgi:aryl-alcohol dehydrogenase-like predicted oxidoreductase